MKIINKINMQIIVLLLVINISSALTTYEETSTVSRIVGESPTEMLRQMQRDNLDISHATFYGHEYEQSYNDKKSILNKQFSGNKYIESTQWDVKDFEDRIKNFLENELFIAETSGGIEPLHAKAQDNQWGQPVLYPNDLRAWQLSFETNNPLIVWDSPYAGSYLPKEDTFVSRLVRDSTIIAPTSFNSPQFTKSFLCHLVDDKTIGEIFKDARNFHYNGGSDSASNNLIGLVLQSYALYGNPRQIINMDFDVNAREEIRKYCNNFLENLAPNIEFLEQTGNYSKFRKHMVFEIPDYFIEQVEGQNGNFSIINAENTFQNQEYGELVLPIAVRTTHFPTNTIITNFSLDYVNDFVDLNVNNLPSYESNFVNRTCYNDYENYSIEFESAYAENSYDFIARISPVEMINCTQGTFRLYKKFNYSVDYIALSPVLIKNVNAPILLPINSIANVSVELLPLTNNVTNGSLAVFDQNNNKVWEEETTTNITDYNASFVVPSEEGIYKYSVEFIADNKTLNYYGFSLFAAALEPRANISGSLSANPNIEINFYSYSDKDFGLNAKYYLAHGNDILKEGEFTKTLIPGNNLHQLSFSGLAKENQSYTLTFELNYLGQGRTISYILTTNNAPIVYAAAGAFKEGENAVINYTAMDYDGDSLTVSINDSRFTQKDNSFEWQTGLEDEGTYDVLLTATDGLLSSSHAVTVNVNNLNQAPKLDAIDNISIDEGDLAIINVTASDPDNDTLTFSINDSRFVQDDNVFTWQTGMEDGGTYDILISVSDGELSESQIARVIVNEANFGFSLKKCRTINESGTYTLIKNVSATETCFSITADNVILDGSGYSIKGDDSGFDYGIYTYNIKNITIKNFNIADFRNGIYLTAVNDSLIQDNTLNSNLHGIVLDRGSSHNKIANNTAILSGADQSYQSNGIGGFGIYLNGSKYNEIISNVAKNNSYGIFIREGSNNSLTSNIAQQNRDFGIYLYRNSNNTAVSNTLTENFFHGISIFYSNSNIINSNNASYNRQDGIYVSDSEENLIGYNDVSYNLFGIYMEYGSSNTISLNIINKNGDNGISISHGSRENVIKNNILSSNAGRGIYISNEADSNTIFSNMVENNKKTGIFIEIGKGNKIYNNFFNNTDNAAARLRDDPDYKNIWNADLTDGTNIINGKYIAGNFWGKPDDTGFSQTCSDADANGICDYSYLISERSVDEAPLTYPGTIGIYDPVIRIFSPENDSFYSTTEVELNWTSSKNLEWCAYSLNNGENNTDICPSSVEANISIIAAEGLNSIILYGKDSVGYVGQSDYVYFTVNTSECNAGETRLCEKQSGVCLNSFETCSGGKWLGCMEADYINYNSSYEKEESICDALDNDCDGTVDKGFEDDDEDDIADCVDDDLDNDGIDDEEDNIIGKDDDINFAGEGKSIKIGIADEEEENVKKVKINNSNKPLMEFDYNFSKGSIKLKDIIIEKQNGSDAKGFTLVKGLSLNGHTKSVFVDRLIDGSNSVCVKDKIVAEITEVSGDCSGAQETLLACHNFPPSEEDALSCQFNAETDQFKISGLRHSAVMEQCTDGDGDGYLPVGCDSGLDCNDNNNSINPDAEDILCDGIDNNCNGQKDEDYLPDESCFLSGACIAENTASSCVNGVQTLCSTGIPADNDASCNNIDDDCDNGVDEEYAPMQTSCGVGACEATGTTSCVNGNVQDSCTAGTPDTETCNNVDDNCNGNIDEDLTRETTCGVGACYGNTGYETCSAGMWGDDACNPYLGSSAEICEGSTDENCDGAVDEGCECIDGQTKQCGATDVGICEYGTQTCSDGMWGIECVGEIVASIELCDNKDNDCDNNVDEGCSSNDWTAINGNWEYLNGKIKPTSQAYGGHALIVENFEAFDDIQVKVKVNTNEKTPEVGVCGRMSLDGKGYCLSYGWGRTRQITLSYYNGYPYNPTQLKAGPHIEVNNNPELYLKFQLKGNAIKGKVWPVNASEPDWQVETVINLFASGFIGYYTYYTEADFDVYTTSQPSDSKEEAICQDLDNDGQESAYCGGFDCNDNNESMYLGAQEICNSADDDCDGEIDEGCLINNSWNVVNGDWKFENNGISPISYGYGGHAIIVENNQNFSNAIINTTVFTNGNELGLCGRMSQGGEGYCLSWGAWGIKRVSILHYNGFPYQPQILNFGPQVDIPPDEILKGRNFHMKLMLNNNELKGKVWPYNEKEPDWQVQTTDDKFASGSAGYYTYYTKAIFTDLSYEKYKNFNHQPITT